VRAARSNNNPLWTHSSCTWWQSAAQARKPTSPQAWKRPGRLVSTAKNHGWPNQELAFVALDLRLRSLLFSPGCVPCVSCVQVSDRTSVCTEQCSATTVDTTQRHSKQASKKASNQTTKQANSAKASLPIPSFHHLTRLLLSLVSFIALISLVGKLGPRPVQRRPGLATLGSPP
jgi:hypothetical protein